MKKVYTKLIKISDATEMHKPGTVIYRIGL